MRLIWRSTKRARPSVWPAGADEAIATLEQAKQGYGSGAATEIDRLQATVEIGLAKVALGRFDAARQTLTDAIDGFRRVQIAPTPSRAEAQLGLAEAMAGLQRFEDADALFDEAEAFWRAFDPRNPAAAAIRRIRGGRT